MTKNRKLKQTIRDHASLYSLSYRIARANVLANSGLNVQSDESPFSVTLGYMPDASLIGWAPAKVSSLAVSSDDPEVRSGFTNSVVKQLEDAGHFVAFHSINREVSEEVISAGLSDFTRLAKRTMSARVQEEAVANQFEVPDEEFEYYNLDDRDLFVVAELKERITPGGAELLREKLSVVIQTGQAFGVHVVLIASDDEVFNLVDEAANTLRVSAEGDVGSFAIDLGPNDPGSFVLGLSDQAATSSDRIPTMA